MTILGWMEIRKFKSFIFFLCLLPLPGNAETKLHPLAHLPQVKISFAPVVKKVAPAVVNIYATRFVTTPTAPLPFLQDPFFHHFSEGGPYPGGKIHKRVQNSLGSGVIVRPDGLIVTNYHVIQHAREIRVLLSDHREFLAHVQAVDPETDLALLKIAHDQEVFPFLELGNADDLEVGDFILAVGNPFGVGQTITHGIISAVNRMQLSKKGILAYIQTDAAINPGNSGGALVNLEGYLVGISTAIYSKSGGSVGIGFATPTTLIAPLLTHLESGMGGIRAWIGVTTTSLTTDFVKKADLKSSQGAVIISLDPRGPGAQAGLKVDDIILKINDQSIQDAGSFRFRVATLEINHVAHFVVMRKGHEHFFSIKAKAPPL